MERDDFDGAKKVCVFCGANTGHDHELIELVHDIGVELAKRNAIVVCGGGSGGLMSVITNATINNNGKVIGVFCDALLHIEQPHPKLTKLIRTSCMSSRKKIMFELANIFLILPGGYGTLDEIFETLMANILIEHTNPLDQNKQIILFNHRKFWNYTLKQISRMIDDGFIKCTVYPFIVANNLKQLITSIDLCL